MSIDRIIQGAIAVATLLAVVYSCQSGRKADKANKISEKANQIADKALYTAELSPFDPTFVASDPIWKVEEVDRNKKVKLALVLTIIVSNNGAQPGCIEDLVAALELPVTADQRKL